MPPNQPMSLSQMQKAFRAGVIGGGDGAAAAISADRGLDGARRLQIYRNNTQSSLEAVLAAGFPVVAQLVGDAFFAAAARRYVALEPPDEARLSTYGRGFPAFLRAFEPARAIAYLGEVADLEWARNDAYFAADAEPLDVARLADLPPEAVGAQRFALHPATRLLRFAHPAHAIWRAHQVGPGESVRLDPSARGPEAVVVTRPATTVAIRPIALADWTLLDRLAAGAALGEAAEAAFAEDPNFALQAALSAHFLDGVFI